MKLVSYTHKGASSFGAINQDGGIVDLRRHYAGKVPDIKTLLAKQLLPSAAQLVNGQPTDLSLVEVELLPVIPNPGKIICVGLNYHDHVKEGQREVTEDPALFIRCAESQVAHDQAILLPRESTCLDYEGELAIVIGLGGRRIEQAAAWQHVAGYACYNDASVRDWQRATSQWTAGKNFYKTGAFGPWLLTADEVAPGECLTLTTRLNGVEVQRATTSQLIHSIPRMIAFVSTIAPLAPGDVIVTGTPGGVGARRQPPLWMKPGDTVEVEVDRIGILRNQIAQEPAV